ncbi:DUF1489 domain-containing protein [Novosphingobium sp.]|uniref:DUF1489 family protein n=1 Tax=Novosphingobium sp. TaxID=1874826 RepID=UPI0025EB7ACD|nr:DUF1489 domain-containing protein [Novosphingobium sp.]MCC6924932.1 DUF1489 domain-containing protein [Novosphingobium sp.]
MPLHLTKVAFKAQSLEEMHTWFADRGDVARLTTRYLPKRHAELVGGSLFWIFKRQLVARSEILGFEEAEGGRTHIVISTRLIDVLPKPHRAHQGWRYLNDEDAPRDLAQGEVAGDAMPGQLAADLARLGLV